MEIYMSVLKYFEGDNSCCTKLTTLFKNLKEEHEANVKSIVAENEKLKRENRIFTGQIKDLIDQQDKLNGSLGTKSACNSATPKESKSTSYSQRNGLEHSQKTVNHNCSLCKRTFPTAAGLRMHNYHVHSKEAEDQEKFVCDLCGLAFPSKMKRDKHYRVVHNPSYKLQCKRCGKGFAGQRYLKKHLDKICTGVDVPCPLCAKSFPSAARLQIHIECTHLGTRVTCPHCPASLLTTSLYTHIRKFHSFTERCSHCAEYFPNKYELDQHVKLTHNNPKQQVHVPSSTSKTHSYFPIRPKVLTSTTEAKVPTSTTETRPKVPTPTTETRPIDPAVFLQVHLGKY